MGIWTPSVSNTSVAGGVMSNKRLQWAGEVSKYIDLWHRIESGTGGRSNESPYNRKERGSWRPPVGTHAHKLWDENRLSGRLIGAELDDLEKVGTIGYGGLFFRDLLREMRENPGARRTWKQAEDLYPNTEEARKSQAVAKMCELVAGVLLQARESPYWPLDENGEKYNLYVSLHPTDQEANNPVQARNRDNNRRKKRNAEWNYETLIYPQWKAYRAALGDEATELAAKHMFCEAYRQGDITGKKGTMSMWKLYEAIKHVEGEDVA